MLRNSFVYFFIIFFAKVIPAIYTKFNLPLCVMQVFRFVGLIVLQLLRVCSKKRTNNNEILYIRVAIMFQQ